MITVMPVVARDLHGLALYGWVFSSFELASLVGIVVAGHDATGTARRPFVAGLVLFSAGLLVAGLAPAMWVLVVGRILQGLGGGRAGRRLCRHRPQPAARRSGRA